MRLHAFLLAALFAIAARAATIPESVAEKKISVVPENTDKTPENASSEQELIDQSNTINDVDNKLRTKPEDIPVEVIVENVAVKTADTEDESEEIVRPKIDLANPGPPQRQEHETQNPEFYSAEQQIVQSYKDSINNAQVSLKQGLQSVSDNVQDMLQNNEQINLIQQNLQTVRENFMAQVNKLNATIQYYLNPENSQAASPVEQQTKANIQIVENSLTSLKNDFNRGVQTLTEGVEVIAGLRSESENPVENKPSTGASPAPAAPQNPIAIFGGLIASFQDRVQSGMSNFTQTITNMIQGQGANPSTPEGNPPAAAQQDTPAAPQPPNNWLPNWQGLNQTITNFQQNIQNFFSNFQNSYAQTTPASVKPAAPATGSSTSEETKPDNKPEPAPAEPAYASTTIGPIRQILQNNPISQSIANAVQRLQNINNPEKPREPTKTEEPAKVDDKPKGHPPAVRNNINIDGSSIEESEPIKQVENESIPESPEPKKQEDVKDQKTEQVVEKTE